MLVRGTGQSFVDIVEWEMLLVLQMWEDVTFSVLSATVAWVIPLVRDAMSVIHPVHIHIVDKVMGVGGLVRMPVMCGVPGVVEHVTSIRVGAAM